MNNLKPRIVCAAMLMKDGAIVTGARHFDSLMRKTIKRIYGENGHLEVEAQGFIDQFGTFYTRELAWAVARKNGQIIRPTGWEMQPCQPKDLPEDSVLFSENLY